MFVLSVSLLERARTAVRTSRRSAAAHQSRQSVRMETGDVWTLRLRERLLGTIELAATDFPWVSGTWTPTAAYEEVAPLFADELQLLDADDNSAWDQAYQSIYDAGVRLHYPDGRQVPEFLLHIDGTMAWFRWSDEPFPVGGTVGT